MITPVSQDFVWPGISLDYFPHLSATRASPLADIFPRQAFGHGGKKVSIETRYRNTA